MKSATWILILSFGLSGCVSVKLAGSGGGQIRATGVQVGEPGRPFSKDKNDDVDGAWKNGKNGNMISYLSDCQESSDPSLDSIVQGAIFGLTELNVEKTESPMVQGRGARRVLVSGKVDGVPSKIDLLVFKRNHCIYMLSYVGVQKSFDQDHKHFDTFIQGFRAP